VRPLQTAALRIAVRLKHGPGGTGERGECDPDCLKCLLEQVIGMEPLSHLEVQEKYALEKGETLVDACMRVLAGYGHDDVPGLDVAWADASTFAVVILLLLDAPQ
jgi:hypothetical protein